MFLDDMILEKVDFEQFEALIKRPPDFIIGPQDAPYLRRWFLLPRNDACNIYLHEIRHDDIDLALHDHPYDFESTILRGSYLEHRQSFDGKPAHAIYKTGDRNVKRAESLHRLQVLDGPVWTLLITGPRRREWGFETPDGWVHWEEFENNQGKAK